VPGVAVRIDGADAGHGAVDDEDHALEASLAGGSDVPPHPVGIELCAAALADLAVPPAGVGVDLAGPGVAVDDQDDAAWTALT